MRTANRVLAAVIGLLLLVGGLLTAIEIAVAYAGGGPWIVPYDQWYQRARSHAWESDAVRGLFIVMTAVGLALLILQLVRRAPATVAIRPDADGEATYAVRRRTVERSLVRSAEQVDGVESARARIDRRSIRVSARSNRRLPGDLRTRLEHAVQERVRSLELETEPRVRLNVRLRKGES